MQQGSYIVFSKDCLKSFHDTAEGLTALYSFGNLLLYPRIKNTRVSWSMLMCVQRSDYLLFCCSLTVSCSLRKVDRIWLKLFIDCFCSKTICFKIFFALWNFFFNHRKHRKGLKVIHFKLSKLIYQWTSLTN